MVSGQDINMQCVLYGIFQTELFNGNPELFNVKFSVVAHSVLRKYVNLFGGLWWCIVTP